MMIRCGNHCFRRKPRSSLDTQDSESITNTKREEKKTLTPNDYGDEKSPKLPGALGSALCRTWQGTLLICKVGVLNYLPQEVVKLSFLVNKVL